MMNNLKPMKVVFSQGKISVSFKAAQVWEKAMYLMPFEWPMKGKDIGSPGLEGYLIRFQKGNHYAFFLV